MSTFSEMDLRLALMALVHLRDTARRTEPQNADLAAAIVDAETAAAAITTIVHARVTDGDAKVVTDRIVAHTASLALDYAAEVADAPLAGVLRVMADRFRVLLHERERKPFEPGFQPIGYVTEQVLMPADFHIIGALCSMQARAFRQEGDAAAAERWQSIAKRAALVLNGADPATAPFHVEEMRVIAHALDRCDADAPLVPRVRATAQKLHTLIEAGEAEARAARSLS